MVQTGSEWEDTIDRIGRWVDMDNAYRTMDKDFMESVWWAFKELYGKGKIYEGERVLLYCVRDATPISKDEVAMDNSYQDDTDPSVFIGADNDESSNDEDDLLRFQGHAKSAYPNSDLFGNPMVTFVDRSGVHPIPVQFCKCSNASAADIQLFQMGFFPASFLLRPQTAFTFGVLNDFLIDNLECKTSAQSYYEKLRQLTSAIFPHLVPACLNSVSHS